MRCLPFSQTLYRNLKRKGLDALTIWRNPRENGRTGKWYLSEEALEDDLLWLIKVGVLRREVDGQGLTSRFRLTPLGRELIDNNSNLLEKPI